ncbi:lysine-2,3-aminomutase-like protein [Leptospira interrogans]
MTFKPKNGPKAAMSRIDKTIISAAELAAAGLIEPSELQQLERVAARYAVSITPAMAELIDVADPLDPIATQFVPDPRELVTTPEENADPIGDEPHSPLPGLVHRYPDRVLLKVCGVCPVYCRFCFRREMVGPGQGRTLTTEQLTVACDYIRDHPEIWEVILTGGDPFILSARRISDITAMLSAIPHVKVLRWHTRVPVVDPDRVTPELVSALKSTTAAVWVALHANHPRELTSSARTAIAQLVDAGIPMVSQTVLLKGVNDDAETLGTLMRSFVECRIKPYYLHHGDLAPGTSHLRTSIVEGQAIMRGMRGRVSGLCQPTYVLDIPGGAGKVPIGPCHLHRDAEGYRVEDMNGQQHDYRDEP